MTEVNYIQKLHGFIRVCGECIEDLEMSRRGVPVYYNMDFSLLCPVLFNFPNAPTGSKDFLISEKDSTTRILDKNPGDGHFKLVVSGPTITEFFDQLDHSMRHIQTQIPALQNRFRVKDMEDERILRNTISTSSDIRRQLAIVTQKGLDESLRAPINRLLSLLDKHKLQGIGDVLDPKTIRNQTDKATFDKFVAEQSAFRPDDRYPEDRTFHFKIDASNVCLALAASHVRGIHAPFVTTTPMNIKQCTLGDQSFA